MQLVVPGWATPPSRWRSCSRENFIASTARHRVLPNFVMQATWSHLISKWSMGTRGGMRKGCTARPRTWTHYYGMDKRTALGSHHAVRITRNPMDLAKLRWDQFNSLSTSLTAKNTPSRYSSHDLMLACLVIIYKKIVGSNSIFLPAILSISK